MQKEGIECDILTLDKVLGGSFLSVGPPTKYVLTRT
jgi:hypothetical protein